MAGAEIETAGAVSSTTSIVRVASVERLPPVSSACSVSVTVPPIGASAAIANEKFESVLVADGVTVRVSEKLVAPLAVSVTRTTPTASWARARHRHGVAALVVGAGGRREERDGRAARRRRRSTEHGNLHRRQRRSPRP